MDLFQGLYLGIFRDHILKTLRQSQKKISHAVLLFRTQTILRSILHMLIINVYLEMDILILKGWHKNKKYHIGKKPKCYSILKCYNRINKETKGLT